jgi:hypothetical protein
MMQCILCYASRSPSYASQLSMKHELPLFNTQWHPMKPCDRVFSIWARPSSFAFAMIAALPLKTGSGRPSVTSPHSTGTKSFTPAVAAASNRNCDDTRIQLRASNPMPAPHCSRRPGASVFAKRIQHAQCLSRSLDHGISDDKQADKQALLVRKMCRRLLVHAIKLYGSWYRCYTRSLPIAGYKRYVPSYQAWAGIKLVKHRNRPHRNLDDTTRTQLRAFNSQLAPSPSCSSRAGISVFAERI